MTLLFFEKKSRQKKLQLSGTIYRVFRLLCVKGAPPKAVRDFFTTLQPLRGFRTRLGDACKRASHTRKSLPPLRGPPPLTQGRHIQTHLGDSCKSASHTRKSLYTREPFLIKSQLCRTASLRFSLLSLLSAQRFVPRRKCVKKFYKKRKIYGNKSEYMI